MVHLLLENIIDCMLICPHFSWFRLLRNLSRGTPTTFGAVFIPGFLWPSWHVLPLWLLPSLLFFWCSNFLKTWYTQMVLTFLKQWTTLRINKSYRNSSEKGKYIYRHMHGFSDSCWMFLGLPGYWFCLHFFTPKHSSHVTYFFNYLNSLFSFF